MPHHYGRRTRLTMLISQAQTLPVSRLKSVIADKEYYQPLARLAALRVLIARAPIQLTRGAPYLHRKRIVREFHGV